MDKLIFRKLTLDILTFFLLSSLAITLIVWVIQAVNFLDVISEDGHGFGIYFKYTLLNIPKIFSKLIVFTYFITLFVILNKYEENNEILVFWTNGIKKIYFINFIAKISILFVIIQMILNLYIVPYTQDKSQNYLKNSSIDFFPKLIQKKKFSDILRNFTIYVEDYKDDGTFHGVYIKEKINSEETKIVVATSGEIINDKSGFKLNLSDGEIFNLNKEKIFNINFKKTVFDLSSSDTKIRKIKKLNETGSLILLYCLEEFLNKRKNDTERCGKEDKFLIKDIYQELFKRAIIPIYLIIISLLGSSLILKPKNLVYPFYYKFSLFFFGFSIIIFSQLSHKLIFYTLAFEILTFILPFLLIIFFLRFLIL